MKLAPGITSNYVTVATKDDRSLKLHFLEQGQGAPILLLHGWPTSSYLWRNVMPALAENNRVIALDLPGFGLSDKPLDVNYSFRFYNTILNAFLDALAIENTAIVVHDLGGPIGIKWVVDNPERATALGILNTVVYPQMSWAVKAFIAATHLPIVKQWISSAHGLKSAMHFGMKNKTSLGPEEILPYQRPFASDEARRALLKAAQGLSPKAFKQMEKQLKSLDIPLRLIYGVNDRILPDIAKTMQRLQEDFPSAELTKLDNCGHFLQEDDPRQVGELLADFFSQTQRKHH